MVTLATPGTLASGARAAALPIEIEASASTRPPALEPASPSNEASPAALAVSALEVAWPTLPGDEPAHRADGRPDVMPPPVGEARLPQPATALNNQSPERNTEIVESAVPGADLRWLADRLERLLRDEARAHGISV